MDVKYTAHATSSGDARNGHIQSDDQFLDQDVRMPKDLGGPGGATNPEQLFAAGYAACFHQALKNVGAKQLDLSGSTVDAAVGIGPQGEGFGLAVTLTVTIPGADKDAADKVAREAHQVCPYSNATRGNVDVDITTKV